MLNRTVGRRIAWGHALQFPEGILQLSLAAEVGEVRLGIGIRDAHMDDPADAGPPGRIEHHAGLPDALLVGPAAVVDPDPVGVEEGVGAPQGFLEPLGAVEVKGVQLHPFPEGVGPLRVARDGLDPLSLREEELGDVPARVARGSRDRVQISRHGFLSRGRLCTGNVFIPIFRASLFKWFFRACRGRPSQLPAADDHCATDWVVGVLAHRPSEVFQMDLLVTRGALPGASLTRAERGWEARGPNPGAGRKGSCQRPLKYPSGYLGVLDPR